MSGYEEIQLSKLENFAGCTLVESNEQEHKNAFNQVLTILAQ
jgi:hypothetical protein